MNTLSYEFRNRGDFLAVQSEINDFFSVRLDYTVFIGIEIALNEALNNCFCHANQIELILHMDEEKIMISVKDNGNGYNALKRFEDLGSKGEEIMDAICNEESGRGLYIIRHFLDHIECNSSGCNLIMIKYIKNRGFQSEG